MSNQASSVRFRRTALAALCLMLGAFTTPVFALNWSPPQLLNSNAASDNAIEYTPAVDTDGAGNWIAVWTSSNLMGSSGSDSDVCFSRSTDNGQTWSSMALLNASNASGANNCLRPTISSGGSGVWVAAWHVSPIQSYSDQDIVVTRSTDNGLSWSAPAFLNSNAQSDFQNDFDVHLENDGAGNWIAVWNNGGVSTSEDVFYSRSSDNGLTWSPIVALNPGADTDTTWEGYAHVTRTASGLWIAGYSSYPSTVEAYGSSIVVRRSSDNGATWSAPVTAYLNPINGTNYDYLEALTAGPDGVVSAIWHEDQPVLMGVKQPLFISRSSDQGVSWSPPARLVPGDDTASLGVSMAAGPDGTWLSVFQSTHPLGFGTETDIAACRSTDNASTWSPPTAVNSYASSDSTSDGSAALATNGAGLWVCLWCGTADGVNGIGSDGDVFVSRSTNNGVSWSTAATLNSTALSDTGVHDQQLRMAGDGVGRVVSVWQTTGLPDTDVRASVSNNSGTSWSPPMELKTNAASDNETDSAPDVAWAGGNNYLAVWTATEAGNADVNIRCARSADGGASWTGSDYVNANASSANTVESAARVACDRSGNAVAVWQSNDQLGGTGTDYDIHCVRSSNYGATWSASTALNANAASDSAKDISPQVIWLHGNTWLCAWKTDSAPQSGSLDDDLMYVRSTDGGASWSVPAYLNTNAASDGSQYAKNDDAVRLASDGNGIVIALWHLSMSVPYVPKEGSTEPGDPTRALSNTETRMARSTDDGTTWSAPITVIPGSTFPDVAAPSPTYPSVACLGSGRWIIVWSSLMIDGNSSTQDSDIGYIVSSDNGLTWSAPQMLNTNGGADQTSDRDPVAVQAGTKTVVGWTLVPSSSDYTAPYGVDQDLMFSTAAEGTAAADAQWLCVD